MNGTQWDGGPAKEGRTSWRKGNRYGTRVVEADGASGAGVGTLASVGVCV
jgi:hypothetical protein